MNGPSADEIAGGGFITAEEAAARLGVVRDTVRVMMDRGELAYLRATGENGRARRVSIVSLDHHIRKNLVLS